MNNDSSQKRFLSGVTVLTLSTVIVKVIGLVYKIPMMQILGAEGMGYFNAAYELYTLFFVVATAGLPVAVSILISESVVRGRLRNAKKIYRVSFALFFGLGLVGALIMSCFSRRLAFLVGSPLANYCILLIAPTVFFIAVASAVRGFFQGNQNMVPTAISQVIEALGKLFLGVFMAVWASKQGYPSHKVAAFAVVGLVAGSAVSMLYLLLARARSRQQYGTLVTDLQTESATTILSRLLLLAIPVTVSSALSGLTRIVDMTVLMRRLTERGVAPSVATSVFGSYSTMAVPIYHLPSSLIAGLAMALVPSLAAAAERGDREREKRLTDVAFRLCAWIAIPCAMGMSVFSRQILSLLFHGQEEAVSVAAPLLSALGLSVLSACFLSVTISILQARKRVLFSIASMAVGTVVKVVSAYVLIGSRRIGVMGAPLSTLLCNTVTVGLNLYGVEKWGKASSNLFLTMLRPFLASSVSVIAAEGIYELLETRCSGSGCFLLAIAACGVCYLITSVLFGALTREEIEWLPVGQKIKGLHKKAP